jgi:ribosomal-protein-alanine N-acetyltransferase
MLIETERLYIRGFTEDDKADYVEIATDPDVMKYIGNGRARTREQAERFVADNIQIEKDEGYARYAVILKEPNIFLGYCGYASLYGNIDFGWQYARRFWNNGYGTEASRAVLKYGIDILRFPLIVSFAHPDNIGSLKIMKKNGYAPHR